MKKIILYIIIGSLLIASAMATVPSGGLTYYNFSSITDLWGSNDGTNNGATSVTDFPSFNISGSSSPNSFSFDGTNDYVSIGNPSNLQFSSSDSFTISGWFKSTGTNLYRSMLHKGYYANSGDTKYFVVFTSYADDKVTYIVRHDGNHKEIKSSSTYNDGLWHHIVAIYDNGLMKLYVDAVLIGSLSGADKQITTQDWNIGLQSSYYSDDYYDEIKIFNRAISAAEVLNLYNCGDSSNCASPTHPNLHIQAKDYNDNSTINTFTVTLANGTSRSTTNGTVIFNNMTIGNYSFDVTYPSGYFNVTDDEFQYLAANSTTYTKYVYPYQALIYFDSFELITNNNLTGANFTVNSTFGTEPFKLKADTNYHVLTENAGYFDKTQTFNVSALDNRTINITGVYSSRLTINATNAYTSNQILNFSGWVYHPGSGNNRTYSTTNGTAYADMIPGNFTVYLEAPGYSITEDNTQNTTINESAHNLSFSLYSKNSILITIRNEDTGLIITDNITIVVTGLNETTYFTTTGSYFLENLTDGNYSIKFSGDNYTIRTYLITVAENSFQNLNSYLTANSDTVIMSYLDEDSGATLEGVSASISRLLGGVWTVVQSKESDITGRIQFIYTPSVKYKFTASLGGYDEKIFYLDPVLFDEYNVKMSKETTITRAPDYQGVTVTVTPSEYYNNQSTNFSITFGSPDGLLESYSYNLSAPTGIFYSGSGTNAYGGSYDQTFTITGADWTDTVAINYCYDTTITEQKCYSRLYEIRDPTVSAGAFTDNLTEDYGLGILERILITLIVTIIVTGVLSLLGGVLLGAPIGLLMMGYLTYIGFMPLWAALPSFLVGFIIIVARSS